MKFIHVSDTHIGCEVPVEYKDIRREDFIKSFEQVIDFAIKEKVDFIIHSGDLLDNYYRINSDITLKLLEILYKLKENNIPLIYIKGNHDIKGNRNNLIEILKKFGLLYEVSLKKPFIYKDVYIYGISEPQNLSGEILREYYKKVLSNFKIENNGYRIFMIHGVSDNLYNPQNFIDYRILSRDILPDSDYYAFGHFHIHKYISDNGKIFALPGSTERTDMSKDEEKDIKGFYYVNDNQIKFIEVKTRPLYIYEKQINEENQINDIKNFVISKSKESIIKLVINYKKGLKGILNNLINNLIEEGYIILDESFSLDIQEEINKKIRGYDIFSNNLFINNKELLTELFNELNRLIEEYYDGRESDIERIREEFYKIILK